MKRIEAKRQVKRIRKLAQRWIRPSGLGWWNIQILTTDRRKSWQREHDPDHCPMTCTADWRYGIATIEVYLPLIAMLGERELETAFVHELMHIFVNEMREVAADFGHEERVCTMMAKAFMWMRGET